jgi:hypothetical protein
VGPWALSGLSSGPAARVSEPRRRRGPPGPGVRVLKAGRRLAVGPQVRRCRSAEHSTRSGRRLQLETRGCGLLRALVAESAD